MDYMNSEILQRSMLFHGLRKESVSAALGFLQAEEKKYRKGTDILHAGTLTDRMGLKPCRKRTVLRGDLRIPSR